MHGPLPHHLMLTWRPHACGHRAGIQMPTVEVRFDDISVNTSVYVGSRALPSVINSYRNFVEARSAPLHHALCRPCQVFCRSSCAARFVACLAMREHESGERTVRKVDYSGSHEHERLLLLRRTC